LGASIGTITGLSAMSKASSVKDACNATTTCPRSAQGEFDSGRTLGDVSTVAFVVGAAGAATMVIGLVLGSDKHGDSTATASVNPWIGVGSVGVEGRFH
jgi:hypothetical protein